MLPQAASGTSYIITIIVTSVVMPKKYEDIRDKCISKGGSTAACKTKAAKIYNATRKSGQRPVTGKHHD